MSVEDWLSAVKDCDITEVKLLINAGADVNKGNSYGNSALMWASINGHLECVELLIQNGAKVNAVSDACNSPLIFASWYGHCKCVKVLIKNGADVNVKDFSGRSAFVCSKVKFQTDCIKVLENWWKYLPDWSILNHKYYPESFREIIIPTIYVLNCSGFCKYLRLLIIKKFGDLFKFNGPCLFK